MRSLLTNTVVFITFVTKIKNLLKNFCSLELFVYICAGEMFITTFVFEAFNTSLVIWKRLQVRTFHVCYKYTWIKFLNFVQVRKPVAYI